MMHHTETSLRQHSRRNARARVRSLQGSVAMVHIDVTDIQATVFTKKINPCWASGGFPPKGDS